MALGTGPYPHPRPRVRRDLERRRCGRVAIYFLEDGVTHASVGPEPRGASFVGRAKIGRGIEAVGARCPGGRFETLRVTVASDLGTFAWVTADGTRTAGCDRHSFEGDQMQLKNAVRKQRG